MIGQVEGAALRSVSLPVPFHYWVTHSKAKRLVLVLFVGDIDVWRVLRTVRSIMCCTWMNNVRIAAGRSARGAQTCSDVLSWSCGCLRVT